MNIVVRSPNWIGDCVMCLPALRALKDYCPDVDIFLLTKNYLKDVFSSIEEIKGIITIPNQGRVRNLHSVSRELRKYQFTTGILLTNSFHSALLFKISGLKNIIGYRNELRGFLLSQSVPYPQNERHHIYFYLELIEAFAQRKITKDYSGALVITEAEKIEVRNILRDYGLDPKKSIIGISSSAAYGSAKEWEADSYRRLIEKIKKQRVTDSILVLGSASERDKIEKIVAFLGGEILNLAGRLKLRQSITAISLCRLFISNDSGLMHVAASLGIPCVAIFGPTLPHKTAPINEKVRVLYHPAPCAPCKYRTCPIDHRCMASITVDEVFDAVESLFSK